MGVPVEIILLRSAAQTSRRSEVISSSTGFFTLSSVMIFYKTNINRSTATHTHTHSCSDFLYGTHVSALYYLVCTFEEGLKGGTQVAMTTDETASGERSCKETKNHLIQWQGIVAWSNTCWEYVTPQTAAYSLAYDTTKEVWLQK